CRVPRPAPTSAARSRRIRRGSPPRRRCRRRHALPGRPPPARTLRDPAPHPPGMPATARPRRRTGGEGADRSWARALRGFVRLDDEVGSKPPQIRVSKPGSHEDTLGTVDALVDRRTELVELRELAAVLVREQQPDRLEALGETGRDRCPQVFE